MATSTHLPLCIYCGTPRPADETRCPHCGRPWIDIRVGAGSAAAPAVATTGDAAAEVPETPAIPPPPPAVDTSVDTGNDAPPVDGSEPAEDPGHRLTWIIPALIAVVAVVVFALFKFGVLDGGTVTAAPPTTAAPSSTVPPTTTPEETTTTSAATTTTTVPPTTIPSPGDLAPVGDPIPLDALTLRSAGIGPIDFGGSATEAIGRLVSSIGEPSETGAANEDLGLCEDDDGRFVRWDGLTAIVSGTLDTGTFVGYRYDEIPVPTMQLDLATPSGLRVGDSVARLNEIYAAYQIDYLSTAGTDVFRLSDDTGPLLWGPVSSPESTGRVEGIYAPDACSN